MSETPSYPAPDPAYQSPTPAGSPLDKLTPSNLLWIQAIGGIVAVFSTFLPWFSASGFGMSGSANGFEKYATVTGEGGLLGLRYEESSNAWAGILVLLLGLAIAALAFVKVRGIEVPALQNLPPILPVVLSGAMLLVTVIKWIGLLGDSGSFGDDEFTVEFGTSVGIWLLLIAALATFAAAALPLVKKKA